MHFRVKNILKKIVTLLTNTLYVLLFSSNHGSIGVFP